MPSEIRSSSLWLYKSSWRRWGGHKPLVDLHVAYFLLLSIVGGFSLWLSPNGETSSPLSFIDALFSAISAVTETGLSNVPMHSFTIFNQVTILLLMLVGSQVFTSAIALLLRWYYSNALMNNIHRPTIPLHDKMKEESRRASMVKGGIRRSLSMPNILGSNFDHNIPTQDIDKCVITIQKYHHKLVQAMDKKAHKLVREKKAIAIMSRVTIGYFVVSLLMGYVFCHISIMASPNARVVLKAYRVNTGFFSLFAVVSALGNCGYILLDDNLEPLQRETAMLLCLWVVILIGNTMYAPTMRWVIWLLYKLNPEGERKSLYEYILTRKTRHFTHLFPRDETWWLVIMVGAINGVQILSMLGLDWTSEAMRGLASVGHKIIGSLFQSACSRTTGMNIITLSGLSSATLFLTLAAMYIASYPIHSCEKEMGLSNGAPKNLKQSMLIEQLGKLMTQNSFLVLAILLVCFFERDSTMHDPINFSFFNITFEVISAYSNTGLSIGYDCKQRVPNLVSSMCTNIAYSFCGKWSIGGKMTLIIVMFLGRHRSILTDIDWNSPPT